MVFVDYAKIDTMLQIKGMSRRQLAAKIGVSADTLSASFRRHSRMKTDSLWRIAEALDVHPSSLVKWSTIPSVEEYELATQAFNSYRDSHDAMVEDKQIVEILRVLRCLNAAGLRTVESFVLSLAKAPDFQKTPSEQKADQERAEADYLRTERDENRAEMALEYEADRKALEVLTGEDM